MSDSPEPITDERPPGDTLVCEQLMAELVKLRRKRKIGQEPIAKAIGITQARVSQMENQKSGLTLEAVIIYAREVGANLVIVPDTPARKPRDSDSKT